MTLQIFGVAVAAVVGMTTDVPDFSSLLALPFTVEGEGALLIELLLLDKV